MKNLSILFAVCLFSFLLFTTSFAQVALKLPPSGAPNTRSVSVINGVSVPSDFPRFTPSTLNSDKTAPGRIFIGNWSWTGDRHYMMVLENDGTPYYYKRLPAAHERDFKLQKATGTYTRRVYDDLNCFLEMDSLFEVTDTLRCQNGLGTDEHEVQLTADHHCLMIGLDYRQVDMSKLVSGGSTNATVIGNTVQELDEHHNVVFEWKSWDHFLITDAVHENLQANSIDYVHMNSIAVDYDSNLIISSRHLSEVTKIERGTGRILWRFGGAHNQFQIINDAALGGPSYQHDARPVPGKPNHYTMMDNGNFHTPSAVSRAVEFVIDTVNWRATKIWEYRHVPSDYYTSFMGNVQRLPNGNTLIDWGDAPLPKATEVTPEGEIVYEANFEKTAYCYRAYRFEYEGVQKAPYLILESATDKVTLIFNRFGDKHVRRYIVYAGTAPHPTTPIDSTAQTWMDLTAFTTNRTYYFRVTARDSSGEESAFSNEESALIKFVAPGSNFIVNSDFADGSTNWTFNVRNGAQAQGAVVNGEYRVSIDNGGTSYSDIQLIQESFPLVNGKKYVFEFDARADSNRIMEPRVALNGGAYTVYSKTGPMVITTAMKHYRFPFTMTDPTDNNARVVMNCGTSTVDCTFDNISVKEDVAAAVDEAPAGIVQDFFLEQNYPNPFNPSTAIGYQLPGSAVRYAVSLEIYDVMGRNVATLEHGEQSSGRYTVRFDASRCASGLYYCRLVAQPAQGGTALQAARKLLLMK